MTRPLVAVGLVWLLSACSTPVFVPEAGPGAPGYSTRPAPPAPEVQLETGPVDDAPREAAGSVDSVLREDGAFEVSGWALLDADAPRGSLRLVLPPGVDGRVRAVEPLPRPDVVTALGDEGLVYAGFAVTVEGALPEASGVCVLSVSGRGAYRLGGSDDGLCPA